MARSDYTLVLVGKTGHGKSSVGNSILNKHGQNRAFEISSSGTSTTSTCKKASEVVHGVHFQVIDTPGVKDTARHKATTLTEIRNFMTLCPKGVTAIVFVIRYGVKFTDEEESSVRQLVEVFGEQLFKYGIVIFTHGDGYDFAVRDGQISKLSEYLDSQPPYFKDVLQKMDKRHVLFNNTLRGDDAIPQRIQLIENIRDVLADVEKKPFVLTEEQEIPCFPATSTVLTNGKSCVKMSSLQIGTSVVSFAEDFALSKLDTVYFFSHTAEDVLSPFIRITTAGGKTLHLSEGHYIYVGKDALKTGALVAAREVKLGDVVHVVDALDQPPRAEEVIEVKTEIKRGLYCPHTLGGSLVVDGVCVSTYTEMFPPGVAHGLLWPIRVLYRMAPNVAAKIAQPQGDRGIPKWLGWLYDRYMAWV